MKTSHFIPPNYLCKIQFHANENIFRYFLLDKNLNLNEYFPSAARSQTRLGVD